MSRRKEAENPGPPDIGEIAEILEELRADGHDMTEVEKVHFQDCANNTFNHISAGALLGGASGWLTARTCEARRGLEGGGGVGSSNRSLA